MVIFRPPLELEEGEEKEEETEKEYLREEKYPAESTAVTVAVIN